MYNIGVSGAHGTGKTTTLNALAEAAILLQCPYFAVDKYQASRAAQAEMGLDLPDIIKDSALVCEFQNKILQNKIRNDEQYTHVGIRQKYTFVDRTPADMYAYSFIWMQNAEQSSFNKAWFEGYTTECIKSMSLYKIIVFFPIIEEIAFVGETQRATLDTREQHEKLCWNFAKKHHKDIHRMRTITVEDRVSELKAVMQVDSDTEHMRAMTRLPWPLS